MDEKSYRIGYEVNSPSFGRVVVEIFLEEGKAGSTDFVRSDLSGPNVRVAATRGVNGWYVDVGGERWIIGSPEEAWAMAAVVMAANEVAQDVLAMLEQGFNDPKAIDQVVSEVLAPISHELEVEGNVWAWAEPCEAPKGGRS